MNISDNVFNRFIQSKLGTELAEKHQWTATCFQFVRELAENHNALANAVRMAKVLAALQEDEDTVDAMLSAMGGSSDDAGSVSVADVFGRLDGKPSLLKTPEEIHWDRIVRTETESV